MVHLAATGLPAALLGRATPHLRHLHRLPAISTRLGPVGASPPWVRHAQAPPRPAAAAAAAADALPGSSSLQPESAPLAQGAFGQAFLRLFPGLLFYLFNFAIPATVCFAAWGATHAATVLGAVAGQATAAAASPAALTALSVVLSLTTALVFFVVAPLGDLLLGRDLRDLAPQGGLGRVLRGPLSYRLPLYAYVVVHYATLAYAMRAACTGGLAPLASLGLAVSMGVSGAVYFTVAHELLHGSRTERSLADVLLISSGYVHWAEAHKLHHINVATPEDCTSAWRNEPLWTFLLRCIGGNLRSGYALEAKRLAAQGLPLLCLQNRMLWWVGGPLALAAASFAAYGWGGPAFLVGWAAVAIWCVETVNYVEHYGLTRKRLPNGRYERVSPAHSWTTGYMFTDAAAFRLQRHADHHMAARKHYQFLCDLPGAPQLPADYSCLMLLAMVPPLFFRVMNPLLDQYQAQQVQREAELAAA